jgi:hypothetical protein
MPKSRPAAASKTISGMINDFVLMLWASDTKFDFE